MLSVTTFVTSEIAPVPLLWVIPLGIYLLSFTLVFAQTRIIPHQGMIAALPLVLPVLTILVARTLIAEPLPLLGTAMVLNYVGLFVVAMVCHGELAKDRPPPHNLTEFYLWISIGGVAGGVFNALLAPLLFPTIVEYPLTLLLTCLILVPRDGESHSRSKLIRDVAYPIILGCFTAGTVLWLRGKPPTLVTLLLPVLIATIGCWFFRRRPLRFALGILAILVVFVFAMRPQIQSPLIARSFFGVHRVDRFPGQEHIHIFRHGTTMHGMQSLAPHQRRIPLLYFTRSGPLGQAMAILPKELKDRVAIVGLGVGTLAAYADAGQHWTFYEIDPLVESIARDERFFTYLQDSPAKVDVVLGDGRLSLAKAAPGEFGLIILDAYSSDTPPLHLLTREALALYLHKLRPEGVLLFNITNRHLDLEPVFAQLASDAGLFALCNHDTPAMDEFYRSGKMPSSWVVMARSPTLLEPLTQNSQWQTLRHQPGLKVWTDDYTSLFQIFHWR
jgi:hypothetical protein